MKFYISSVIIILIWFGFPLQVKGQETKAESNQKCGLVLYDSLIFKGGNIYLADYNKNLRLYLGYDYYGTDILLYNEKGEIISQFNKYGEGPEEYHFSNSMTARFWDSKSIVVRTNNQLKIYSFEGRFLRTIKIDDGISNSLRLKLFVYIDKKNDTNVVYYADMPSVFPITLAGFYTDTSRKVIVNYNVNAKIAKRHIGFEKNSIYMNGEEYYSDLVPRIYLNHEKRVLDVNFQNEQKIFRYDIDNDFKYMGYISLDADYFGNLIGIPFGKRTDSFKFKQMNSKYINIISYADTIVTMYNKGLEQENVYVSVEERNENIDKIPKYIQVLVNGQKVCKDIMLPMSILSFNYIHCLKQKIIFKKAPNEYDENNNTSTFLIGKIVF